MTSTPRDIEKKRWRPFFDSLTSRLQGQGVDITLSSVEGSVHQSRLWELHGVTYDPHDDAFIVSCRQQEHVIDKPETIRVEEEGPSITLIEISKMGGDREIIRFMAPVALPGA